MFLELKHTDHDVTKQYNRSITQARNVIITYIGKFNKQARKNLKDSVKANLKAEHVMIWKPADENVEHIKKKRVRNTHGEVQAITLKIFLTLKQFVIL